LYLVPLDRALATLGGFAARYGDDILFAHADHDVACAARDLIAREVAARGLQMNAQKARFLFWNGAGRPPEDPSTARPPLTDQPNAHGPAPQAGQLRDVHGPGPAARTPSPIPGATTAAQPGSSAATHEQLPLGWHRAVPTTTVEFLGAAVRFTGTVTLAPAKWRALTRDLHARLVATARLLPTGDPHQRARTLADVLTRALDPRSALASTYAPLLRSLVDDRAQLAELDDLLFLRVAEAATGMRGPRAFRQLPPATLRALGLPSTVVARNQR
jgi:hypothetical protein